MKENNHRIVDKAKDAVKIFLSPPVAAYLAIFSSSRSLGSKAKLFSYISCTSSDDRSLSLIKF